MQLALLHYGNKDWTCVYRLRVHGTPVAPPSKPVFD
jgi:SUN domain-containing protein 1/2